ncbi:unnamed protein product [Soboliphyme baturini]|uniref:DOCKER domain-containing protein n=1 Tax=Soboliphyme baturini TaxID=241478 RepID=A0A183J5Q3_9BILA|nr:unnamed protein product [Soboliphyme baturini]
MLRNPTMVEINFKLQRMEQPKMKNFGSSLRILCEQITDFSKPSSYCAVVGASDEVVKLSPGKTDQRTFMSMVVPFAINDSSGFDKQLTSFEEKAIMLYNEASLFSYESLQKEHVDLWRKTWESGFEISRSLAPHVLNSDVINATLYVMISHSPVLLHKSASSSDDVFPFEYQPHHCYSAHNTL